ncbi:Sas10 C-terminal domain-containing protein [Amylocarpus encephaloides]|uniref:Sas10 C-terminal domain-containing protein n=1 Tax=Amylocarpus encephaloides TaxID=45428 RepID=A0A9P8C014_9HELO|nr:Sas10 C-terminal domain-containing protein [Amylocarpus encephaloides]
MPKKRKASSRNSGADTVSGFEPKGDRHRAITTYEDVADSEDEFHINRDKVMIDEGPDAKRRRKYAEEEEELDASDIEILGYSQDDEEEEQDDEDTPKPPRSGNFNSDDEADQEEEEEEGWGASKKDYYNADEIQTEIDAMEEEAEAKRIQQKKLQKMTDADFGFDESEWLDAEKEDEKDGRQVVTEVLKDVEITPEVGAEERLQILRSRYPEFEFLADEFVTLQPVLAELQQEMEAGNPVAGTTSRTVVKCRALAAYMASLTMYFAILTSTAGRALDPTELQDHPVMDSILRCRTLWSKVKNLKAAAPPSEDDSDSSPAEEPATQISPSLEPTTSLKPSKKSLQHSHFVPTKETGPFLVGLETELEDLFPSRNSKSKPAPPKKSLARDPDDSNSDFGEETHLSTRDAASKAAKKKTLRFYTSQITQKSQKRLGAGAAAGGDDDLPYRERFRDRQMRLNAEAEKRGKVLDASGRGKGRGVQLGGDDSGDEVANKDKNWEDGDDEYYNLVSSTASKRKAGRKAASQQASALAAASALDRIPGEADLDDDQKRAIGYTIEKNKGLAPKRKKEVRNPRVKKRMKFEEKKKKLGSMKAIYKGGEERGGYGGEKTGIKSGLVKSVKL